MKKKCLRHYTKKTPSYAGLGSKQQTFSNYQATYQKDLCLLFVKLGKFFPGANLQMGLTDPSPCSFLFAF